MRIQIQGAAENNLQDVDVEFGDGLTVVTGVSGSGKTSLVFDTLYHEARRRFLESFAPASSSIRLSPARVRAIHGLGPAIAVGQNLLNRNPGSTLATASGLHPFLRLLYARFGARRCAVCGGELVVWSVDAIVERLVELARETSPGSAIDVFAPLLNQVAGSHRTLLAALEESLGREALYVDGGFWNGEALTPRLPHTLEVVVARLAGAVTAGEARAALEAAASLGATTLIARSSAGEAWTVARAPVCPRCGTWFGDLEPVHFNTACPHCAGQGCERCSRTGLHPEAAAVYWQGLHLPDLLALSVTEASRLIRAADLPPGAERLKGELERRLDALLTAGLGYIQLDRPAPTLSRGEAQRVRLAVTLVSRLEDMLHVLDEPTVGQHPADVARLMPAFNQLAGPVVYVEHDRVAAAAADQAVDLGPGAGNQGGQVVYAGTPAGLWAADTPTGRAFSLRERLVALAPRPAAVNFLVVRGADLRNLREIDARIPLGRLTVVTGVSGSGKSTLVEDVLVASLEKGQPVGCRVLEGPMLKPVMVDQSPIGINPRSNAATYTGLADIIRDLYSSVTGLPASRFSFNRPEGACPTCEGMGAVEVQMRYLPSTWIPCADCQGHRFSEEVLAARVDFNGRGALSIADFFNLPVEEAEVLLSEDERLPRAKHRAAGAILEALRDVGLGYLTLGQPSPTLSGGEAQRVKLTKFLGKGALTGRLVVLDEPSTGLHPQDVAGLLVVLDRLARGGATVLVVEHNLDVIRMADWVIDLGPGAGPGGGRLLYDGPPDGLVNAPESLTGQALREEAEVQPNGAACQRVDSRSGVISIREARANNLRGVSVDFPKAALSVVTGVSGSGKSSLVSDVLEAEARRRYLESLSMYERQGVREGPEAPVGAVSGLGVAVRPGGERGLYNRRATVGAATELSYHLAVLLARAGERDCSQCGHVLRRVRQERAERWSCPSCGAELPVAEPRHFLPSNYAAACLTCHGVGTLQIPAPRKLIIQPEKPLCAGAMYSPGFFPKGYLGKPYNGGYDQVQALAAKYGFDPFATPWNEMTPAAQQAFLFGDPEPMPVTYHSRTGRVRTEMQGFPGFYGYVRDWDTGGTYTDTQPCPTCQGSRLRPEYAQVRLAGSPAQLLNELPLADLLEALELGQDLLAHDPGGLTAASLNTALNRLRFLVRVGLGYLHLNRPAATLSAGEAQRIRLAGLLGSQLTGLTVLLDEPSRGLHPAEIEALLEALIELRSAGNTVIVVEHEALFMRAADFLVDMGPGAGAAGGEIVAQGSPETVLKGQGITAEWLRGERRSDHLRRERRKANRWMTLSGARGNNLRGEDIAFPLNVLAGVCGVSGSGKSTLVIDTLGRALAPSKLTTSVSREPLEPEPYDKLSGEPRRIVLVDQSRAGMHSPASFLDLTRPLVALFAQGADAQALGLDEEHLGQRCSACGGRGVLRLDMGFLPPVSSPCEVCRGSGFLPEAWEVRLNGVALPELFGQTIAEVEQLLRTAAEDGAEVGADLLRPMEAAQAVGLGYLVLRQPGDTLSGGEAQRLKIAAELCRRVPEETLYILDEPTVGQHLEDVDRLAGVMHGLVDAGHSVLVVEHHPHLLAACDWLIELGPGAGPRGGKVIAQGPPEILAAGETPIAGYLRETLASGLEQDQEVER